MLALFIKFILAHLIGDFVIQPKSWVDSKEKNKLKSKELYLHVGVHLLVLLVLLQFNMKYVLGIVFIIVSHFIIDVMKLYASDKYLKHKRTFFFIDQILHVVAIFFVVQFYFPEMDFLANLFSLKVLILLSCLIFTTFVANIFLSVILSKWDLTNTSEKKVLYKIEDQEKEILKNEESLENAGMYIGMIERLFIFFLVVFNQPLGVGLLITAKSVFRYNDLTRAKDRKLTEYVLIGSMLSFGLAILAGISYKYLLKLL